MDAMESAFIHVHLQLHLKTVEQNSKIRIIRRRCPDMPRCRYSPNNIPNEHLQLYDVFRIVLSYHYNTRSDQQQISR